MKQYKYICKRCGCVLLRDKKVKWFISYCDATGKNSRVIQDNKEEKMTQRDRVLDYLKTGKTLSTFEAYDI